MKGDFDPKIGLKGKIIIAIEVVFLLTLSILTIGVLKGNTSFKNDDVSLYVTNQDYTENSIVYKEGLTFSPSNEDDHYEIKTEETVFTPTGSGSKETDPITNLPSHPVTTHSVPEKWTTAEIISKARDAVNKTKAYTGSLTVNHSEGFSAEVTECSGGGIVKSVVELMIGWVAKPVEESLVFQNGTAVNSEGETIPIILPKRNGFSLSESGVESATIEQTGNEYIIKINLIEERVGMYDVPVNNAASIGYLDVANFDISFMDIDSANIVYKGSSIELRINADGFVTYANYKIPLHIDGSAHKGSIKGSASFEGEQTEEWVLNY